MGAQVKTGDLIERIRKYTADRPELRCAHHFQFDLRWRPEMPCVALVVGVNPGESDGDWKLSSTPTEETSLFDFHTVYGGGRSSIKWNRSAVKIVPTDQIVQSQIFFWSSKDENHFRERFGSFERSLHLPFCRELNRELIRRLEPKIVICPGISKSTLVSTLYELKPKHLGASRAAGGRLFEVWTDGIRPWIFTVHWTAARPPLSLTECAALRERIASLL
jgi:hypothetical protein